MKVRDSLRQPAVLVTYLQAVVSFDPGVVDLWVGLRGVGELWIGSLLAEVGEPGDTLGVQTAGISGILGHVGDSGEEVGLSEVCGLFAALCPGLPKAELKDAAVVDHPVPAGCELPRAGIERSVVIAARRAREAGRLEKHHRSLAVAEKAILLLVQDKVGATVPFVIGGRADRQILKVDSRECRARDVGCRQIGEGLQGDRINVGIGQGHLAILINYAGIRVLDGDGLTARSTVGGEEAGQLSGRGQCGGGEQMGYRSQALVVGKKEELVLQYRAAEGSPELVLD